MTNVPEVGSLAEAAKFVPFSPLELHGLPGARVFVQEGTVIIVTARLPELGRVMVTESRVGIASERSLERAWRSMKGSKVVELSVVSIRAGIPAQLSWSRRCPEIFPTRILWVENGALIALRGEVLRPNEAIDLANTL